MHLQVFVNDGEKSRCEKLAESASCTWHQVSLCVQLLGSSRDAERHAPVESANRVDEEQDYDTGSCGSCCDVVSDVPKVIASVFDQTANGADLGLSENGVGSSCTVAVDTDENAVSVCDV